MPRTHGGLWKRWHWRDTQWNLWLRERDQRQSHCSWSESLHLGQGQSLGLSLCPGLSKSLSLGLSQGRLGLSQGLCLNLKLGERLILILSPQHGRHLHPSRGSLSQGVEGPGTRDQDGGRAAETIGVTNRDESL